MTRFAKGWLTGSTERTNREIKSEKVIENI